MIAPYIVKLLTVIVAGCRCSSRSPREHHCSGQVSRFKGRIVVQRYKNHYCTSLAHLQAVQTAARTAGDSQKAVRDQSGCQINPGPLTYRSRALSYMNRSWGLPSKEPFPPYDRRVDFYTVFKHWIGELYHYLPPVRMISQYLSSTPVQCILSRSCTPVIPGLYQYQRPLLIR